MWTLLPGLKTHIVAFLMVVAAGAHALGYIDEATYRTVEGILLGGGLAALRIGVTGASR